MEFLIAFVMAALVVLPLILIGRRVKNGKKSKTPLVVNLCSFFGIFLITSVVMLSRSVHAATAVTETVSASAGLTTGLGYISAALAVGISGIGGGIAVSGAASAALGAISENEKAFGKSLIFVGLAEGIALYGLLIAFMIFSKL
jgi:V/A-type H+-transporting ATPase subunit K